MAWWGDWFGEWNGAWYGDTQQQDEEPQSVGGGSGMDFPADTPWLAALPRKSAANPMRSVVLAYGAGLVG